MSSSSRSVPEMTEGELRRIYRSQSAQDEDGFFFKYVVPEFEEQIRTQLMTTKDVKELLKVQGRFQLFEELKDFYRTCAKGQKNISVRIT